MLTTGLRIHHDLMEGYVMGDHWNDVIGLDPAHTPLMYVSGTS
jgi:hypothetical protein